MALIDSSFGNDEFTALMNEEQNYSRLKKQNQRKRRSTN